MTTPTIPAQAAEKIQALLPYQTHREVLQEAKERFEKDTKDHVLQVVHDQGIHRHLRFGRPGSSMYWFEIVTWPGSLTINGDMGTYTFSRLEDMFHFFRSKDINPQYWAEKLQGSNRGTRYSENAMRSHVADYLTQWAEEHAEEEDFSSRLDSLLTSVKADILFEGACEDFTRTALSSFDQDGLSFQDSWEWRMDEYTTHFLWCCHALLWGIQQYDKAQA